jgi:parallel beta-helix repeat protein
VAAPVQAKRIEVEPGKGTLQRAVNRAAPEDKLELEARGVYKGGAVVEKRLTIRGPSEGRRPRIDGRCREAFTILVLDGRVTLNRFAVTGAADAVAGQYGGAEINFIEEGRGSARNLRLEASCDATQYGINVFDTGDVTTSGNRIGGYLDAAIYVGGIRDPEATIAVRENVVRDNNHGILIEDSLSQPQITVAFNEARRNEAGPSSSGIYIRNSDGVRISGNGSSDSGFAGFWLDGNSDFNSLIGNSAGGSGTADLQNDGEGNCGVGNFFGTQAGNPLGAC